MTLPLSGPISFNDINVELGVAGTTQASLGQSTYRTLAGVASGQISMSNFYGKSNRAALSVTYSTNTANATVNVAALPGYIAGMSDITITVNSGVYVYATNTGNAGLTLTGGTTGDTVTLVNNGFIMGMGGAGGGAVNYGNASYGSSGGPALSLGFNTTINNTNASAYIGGGGGGGGGSGNQGGGGGGGAGGGSGGAGSPGTPSSPGGAGGNPGSSGNNGSVGYYTFKVTSTFGGGGGGGRVFPGSGGSGGSNSYSDVYGRGGGAGGGGGWCNFQSQGGAGAGGSANNNGASGFGVSYGFQAGAGGGGGWGASGGGSFNGYGAGGGRAVALNGRTVTWVSGNTTRVYGSVS